jgi:hypothetical protein
MIKYSWALLNSVPIHISKVSEDLRAKSTFHCINKDCPNPNMAAHIKGNRKPHFQHVNYCFHHPESYLHNTAKEVVKATISNCLENGNPFIFEFPILRSCNKYKYLTGITCNAGLGIDKINLLDYYDTVKMERKSDEFRPDIELISSKGHESIFVEIKKTSGISKKKKSSGKRIIEIQIKNEQDIITLAKPFLSRKQPNVELINFELKEKTSDFCSKLEKGCRSYHEFFLIFKDGRYLYEKTYLENMIAYFQGVYGDLTHWEIVSNDGDSEFMNELELVEKFAKKNSTIKSCHFCKYSALDIIKEQVFCKFLRDSKTLNEAGNCNYYRPRKGRNINN